MRSGGLRGSQHLRTVFLAVLLPAAAMLGWLGLRLLDQDRVLAHQWDIESQNAALDAVTRALARALAQAERQMEDGRVPAGTLLVRRDGEGVTVTPASLVAWVSSARPLEAIPERPFLSIELLEFGGGRERALLRYDQLSHAAAPGVRAGALLRSARVLRNLGRPEEALARYDDLARIDGVASDGTPVDLLARRAACEMLQQLNRPAQAMAAARALARDFAQSRWLLDRPTWELVLADLRRWTAGETDVAPDRLALSTALDSLPSDLARAENGRLALAHADSRITIVARESAGHSAALLIPSAVVAAWLRAASPLPQAALRAAVVDDHGRLLAGDDVAAAAIRRNAAESGLPWTVVLSPGPAWAPPPELRVRERLLASALLLLTLFLAGGMYLLWRVVQREVAIAHLQAEFVSAVSHEFRTPLTALRQIVELLQDGDETAPDRRAAYYGVLARNTDRLHRLVESLLDFGRMEQARRPYDLRPLAIAPLVSSVVDEFRGDDACRRRLVEFRATTSPEAHVRADASALHHALWNLLDNAVKYSPGGERVLVSVSPHARGIAIAVSDCGLGVKAAERQEIFDKFVRGDEAIRRGIKGTGVGLAIVRHVMTAHHGDIELDSQEGRGSTFRLVLPACAA